MHICIVAPEQIPVPPIIAGSVEICIYALARQLAKHHQVTIISRSHPKLQPISRHHQLTIIRVASGKSGSYLQSVLKALRRNSYDLIQVDNRPQMAARIKSHFPHTPVTLFLHSLTFVTPPRIALSSVADCFQPLDLIVVNSSSLQSELAARFPSHQQKIRIAMLGVNPGRFRVPSAKTKKTIRRSYRLDGSFNVLFVGRLIPRKGIEVLIDAVRLLRQSVPNARLIIAGGSPMKRYIQKLKGYAAKKRVPTTFLGYVPHRKLHQIYWLGDCFICPSQQHEAFGLVNIEAMASGVPVIASAIGGIKEIIKHEHNGLLVQSFHQPEEFANGMRKLLEKPHFAANLAAAARVHVLRQFSWEQSASRLNEIYTNYLRRK